VSRSVCEGGWRERDDLDDCAQEGDSLRVSLLAPAEAPVSCYVGIACRPLLRHTCTRSCAEICGRCGGTTLSRFLPMLAACMCPYENAPNLCRIGGFFGSYPQCMAAKREFRYHASINATPLTTLAVSNIAGRVMFSETTRSPLCPNLVVSDVAGPVMF
jgi:hypothetical protein